MFGTDLYIAIVLGVLLSLLYAERTGIVPAGLVVPGYLALVFDQIIFVLTVVVISIITYLFVTQVIGRLSVLYGRRKFAAMLTVGVVLKMTFDYTVPIVPFEVVELRGIGVIVPGLIANSIHKQGVLPTISSTFIISFATFLLISLYHLI
ncbi:poly-gamma-glutamate biosynthesis protein PgsC [Salisediminibacterium halotolerans]|uniref:poly-gamma-glutamate biosynthesis protein PgsC n=1 Tax=Salisediminibacterium halotolerans TaxID=517425 RepID=UPI000EAF0858|nr:poly-gamma-glutamate biosynthesis protein PgsC [Salisediminibacterium halotolerans]RLJ73234.1 poly-gamma-glutamate biosynthesis protein PgsC/CapC [Actinophytocola xinjiangensis]RPE86656.1 poly-gamma-glutamate biosynthesis protein PgsC/CapC [Salisediminibacterium halotolerans]TWG34031.1 poly-gamma-glutamate biosynthesis protein PgsC/CapC [Salisediminibacterium halotolerans]GEL08312.1 PGA biosynthesis protein CapC [Salisediminibacterium halotolerans]